jgi:cytidylate kinase
MTRVPRSRKSVLQRSPAILQAAIDTLNQSARGSAENCARPFITVSRQAGAGAVAFSHRLAERLNQEGSGDWHAWDHELVEKVSSDHGIAKAVLEMIPYQSHTWFNDLVHSFSESQAGAYCDESFAYKRVALTIGALASAGHAIIVGRGARFITGSSPGGLHLRLIAPLDQRIGFIIEKFQLSIEEASDRIDEMDRNREMFYRRHWPGKTLEPQTFSMTLNASELSVDELVECVLPVIRLREAAAQTASSQVACASSPGDSPKSDREFSQQ